MALRMPWNESMYELQEHGGVSKLCFGLQWHNNHVKPNPPYYRAMTMVRDALIAQGHHVVDFQFPQTAEDLKLLVSLWLRDAMTDLSSGYTSRTEGSMCRGNVTFLANHCSAVS